MVTIAIMKKHDVTCPLVELSCKERKAHWQVPRSELVDLEAHWAGWTECTYDKSEGSVGSSVKEAANIAYLHSRSIASVRVRAEAARATALHQ